MSVTLTGCEGVLEAARSVSRGRREESERARLGFVEATKDMQKIHEAALAALAAKIEAVSQESKLKVLGLERELEVLRAENTSLTEK
ncbi:MAG: hypothetical protein FJZ59_01995 [Chlamydiae bacterium]|nr:hypothetical protein [Chlamydiota bacterium]